MSGQIPGKHILVRFLRHSKHLTAHSITHWAAWLGCTFGMCLSAYVVASAILIFSSLTSLIGSLFGSLMSFQFMGFMWLYDYWSKVKQNPSIRWIAMSCWVIFVIVVGTFLMIGVTYGSIIGIIDSCHASEGSAAWSCADNSDSS